VPVSCYESLVERLRGSRLLALRGAPGTGCATTGLRILADVAAEQVSRFSPDTDINRLSGEDLASGFGYLIELIPGWGKAAAAATDADRLHQQLTDCGCYMVVIVPHDGYRRGALRKSRTRF